MLEKRRFNLLCISFKHNRISTSECERGYLHINLTMTSTNALLHLNIVVNLTFIKFAIPPPTLFNMCNLKDFAKPSSNDVH